MELFIKKYTLVLHLLSALNMLLLFMMSSCAQEQILEVDSSAELAFRVNTKAFVGESVEGVTLNSVRIIIADMNLGNSIIVVNRLIDNQNKQPNDFIFRLRQGKYKICVVANETEAMKSSLVAVQKLSDLDAITVITPTQESNIVLYQSMDMILRATFSAPEQAEVSVDGGNNWVSPPMVTVILERVASKISLAIKKLTTRPEDKFDIKKVELINLPSDSHLIPGSAYTGVLHSEVSFGGTAVSFVNNAETKSIFSDYIVPEYLLPKPASSDDAAALVITAAYTELGSMPREVVYTIPVLGQNALDYSLKRNCHYNITATITQPAEAVSSLIIEYEVVQWMNAGNGSFEAGAVTFSGKWEDDTDIAGNTVSVSNNTSVTYEFTLSYPFGAVWMAQLTNVQDFDFDLNNSGVRQGTTAEGTVYKIKIRPRTAVSTNDVTTEFYITVFNGIENVELNLTKSGTGNGYRFIVKQNPN